MKQQQETVEETVKEPEEYCTRKQCGKPIFKGEPRVRLAPGYTVCDDCDNLMQCQS